MRILFATLHVRRSAQAVPLAAGCLAAALPTDLRRESLLVDFFPDRDPAAIAADIAEYAPELVCMPLYAWNRPVMVAAARLLQQSLPQTVLIAGGPEATADPDGLLNAGPFAAVVRGEGEAALCELVGQVAAGRALQPVPGVSLAGEGGAVHGPDRPPAKPEELNSPWLTHVLQPKAAGGVLWETARGCPFACDYCYDGRGRSGVRTLPWPRLQEELALFARAGVGQAWVLDSTFNFPPQRGQRLLELARSCAPSLHLHLEAKAEFLDRRTIRLLARQPCSLQLGLQSFNPAVLHNIHRTLDADAFRQQVRRLEAEGVTYGLDLIYGLPGDDYRGFAASLEEAVKLRPNQLDLFPLAVLPATALHNRRTEFGLDADPHPPYLLRSSASMTPIDLQRCRRLAGAVDLFYNAGRAVAFFPALLQASALAPVRFFETFADWLETTEEVAAQAWDPADWRPERILALQQRFTGKLLHECGAGELLPAAHDLLNYHFHYAETLLGPEALPAPPEDLRRHDLWTDRWRTSPAVRLIPFHYEILDLLQMGEPDLPRFVQLFRPVGSVALFMRRGDEVLCESLDEDFLALLRGCDGTRAPADVFGGSVSRSEGEEIVEFAVAEGLLQPA